ncbi:MAG: T9SS type A sorting domain-containing protein, partial [bacterium]
PQFYWDKPASISPVEIYNYAFTYINTLGKEVAVSSGDILPNPGSLDGLLDIEVSELNTYILTVKARNETGNWGDARSFTYIYDDLGPKPVNFLQLQGWAEQYFHPLTINLDFPFTEELDQQKMNIQTMKLNKKDWQDNWEDITGNIAYNDQTQSLLFTPSAPLKALAEYKISFKDVYDLAGNTFTGDIWFKTYLGAAMEAEVYSPNGKVKANIPHWGLTKDAIVMIQPSTVQDEIVEKADRKIELRINTRLTQSDIYELKIFDLSFNSIDQFNKDVTLSFLIPDENDDGIWDNTDVRIQDVQLAMLNEEKKDWEIIKDEKSVHITRAPEAPYIQQVSMPVCEAIRYRLISYLAPSNSIDNILIYPTPFRPSKGHTDITFLRLPVEVTINIYNIAGELIKEFPESDQGQIVWDVKNNNGEKVASGVYLAVVKSKGSKKIYKIAIQR